MSLFNRFGLFRSSELSSADESLPIDAAGGGGGSSEAAGGGGDDDMTDVWWPLS